MTLTLDIDARTGGTPLAHHWNLCVGAGRAAEGLRADWQRHLAIAAADCGFRYVRFHGLFHDDMFVYRETEGRVTPTFHYVDLVVDPMLALGVKPFVELGFSPGALAREQGTVFWWRGHGSPPVDHDRWAALVRATIEHWIDRYGLDEVRTWYFEVWNEPNLAPFFRGTRTEYFELYRTTALAVKSVDGELRVGGPATSNFVPDGRFDGEAEDHAQHRAVLEADDLGALDWRPVWLEAFLEFCHDRSLPVDFVSCHPYPTDWALDEHGQGAKLTRPVEATPRDLRLVRRIVDDSQYPQAEIHLTEWSSSSSSRDHTHDYPQAAAYVVKANLESIGTVDSMSYWTFTDIFEEDGAGAEPFHGGFGMLNQHGIAKPTFHAYRMLGELGDELLAQEDGVVATRVRRDADGEDVKVAAVAYHYPEEVTLSVPASFESRVVADDVLAAGSPRAVDLTFDGLTPGAMYRWEVLDPADGYVVETWRALGEPLNLSGDEARTLSEDGRRTRSRILTVGPDGRLHVEAVIGPWSIALLAPEPAA
ncbi:cellulase family glycosylhydrolase [Georgenia halophila]|uniref:Cellulase family glycosylhydrolase n=1 Tax=Georgenia halophila TaxID=620889 RepID=A0ABP8L2Q3_9MICO